MSPFEVGMLACFGLSWPCSIVKSLRTHNVSGKSPLFLVVVAVGYLLGVVHKLYFARDWAILFYGLNLGMVLLDLAIYVRYARRPVVTQGALGALPDCWPSDQPDA
jgi:hypothetical protein